MAESFHLRHPLKRHCAHKVTFASGGHLLSQNACFTSGKPPEEEVTLVRDDPTWVSEYQNFKHLININHKTDLSSSRWIHRILNRLRICVENKIKEQAK